MAMLLEPYPVQDVYCDGISHMENLGNCFRTVYFTYSRSGRTVERLTVAKIVRPISSLLTPRQIQKMIEDQPIMGMLPERYFGNGDHNGH